MHEPGYYSKLGFKCGLEIHQRLATRKKLFCDCSAIPLQDQNLDEIERRQRAVAGELGHVDESTKFESRRRRRFLYHTFRKSTCLVDLDEEPPHDLNREALEIALLVSSSLNAKIPEEIEPMRKEVVDGSDPSAFQRSMLCGYDGSIKVDGRSIAVPSIFLEEESSGIVSSSATEVVYTVDRMGIPLIEIDTDPVISTPQEAKSVAMNIGLLLRLTGKVQRGIGSIRQDVNVSIRGGARTEIKGMQEIEYMDEAIENEVERQLKLIEIKDELARRKASLGGVHDLTGIFKETEAKIIKEKIHSGGVVLGFKLKGFGGLLGKEINPSLRLGSEISDYARMAEAKGIMHSDEALDAYGISRHELERLNNALGIDQNDAFILIAESRERCRNAIELASLRAELAMKGVPSETRAYDTRHHATRFLRPIPGGSRMYPETDALPIDARPIYTRMGRKRIEIGEIKNRLYSQISSRQLAEQMLWSRYLPLYNEIVGKTEAEPLTVASILLEKMRELSRSGIDTESIGDKAILRAFERYSNGEITRSAVEELLKTTPKNESEVDKAISSKKLERIKGNALKRLVKEQKGKSKKEVLREIMSRHRLNVDGEELNNLLGKG